MITPVSPDRRDFWSPRAAGFATTERDLFEREVIGWRINAILRNINPGDATYSQLAGYLGAADDRMRAGLPAQIAARFDD